MVAGTLYQDLVDRICEARGIDPSHFDKSIDNYKRASTVSGATLRLSDQLRTLSKDAEADAIDAVREKALDKPSFGGLGLNDDEVVSQSQHQDILFLADAWLSAIESREAAPDFTTFHTSLPSETRPRTLAQKIFAQHALGSTTASNTCFGDVIRIGIDWILASELSWEYMSRIYDELGSPGIWRNDRFWLAGDHVVHPAIADNPKVKTYIAAAEKAKTDFKMTEYQGMNYTIMHTEFVRERAEPGQLVLGSDSHTCSAGAVGCLAIGLGTADVMMALSLGETWIKIPESILINLTGEPAFGMLGKDVILHILKELKRNTVAAERIVEFAGDGVRHLSCDARFAICNMCTEFGAITGVFVPDEVTQQFVNRRKRKTYKSSQLYFKPDANAEYAGQYTIDLSKVEATVALYPSPDNVVPVSETAGMHLDGVFIGACTTTEEELVMGALILKVGLAKNIPLAPGKRQYVAGSLPIVDSLRKMGLLEVYEAAGFTRGPPGCSLCVGISAEKAAEGETWLSSQNRNFKNRMGKGSFGHLSSAMVCAASSFSMTVTSPADFLKDVDMEFFYRFQAESKTSQDAVRYVEPKLAMVAFRPATEGDAATESTRTSTKQLEMKFTSKVVTLGDFIDTDALAPGDSLTTCQTDEEFGDFCLRHTYPEFRDIVKSGHNVVVAGHAFGVGSSREVAVSALKGVGVKAVIARSFAFIYARNQPALGLLGIVIDNDDFHAAARDGAEIAINVDERIVMLDGRSYGFKLSEIEYNLINNAGISQAYQKYGKRIWEELMKAEGQQRSGGKVRATSQKQSDERLAW